MAIGALIDKIKDRFNIVFEVIKRSELHIFNVSHIGMDGYQPKSSKEL